MQSTLNVSQPFYTHFTQLKFTTQGARQSRTVSFVLLSSAKQDNITGC